DFGALGANRLSRDRGARLYRHGGREQRHASRHGRKSEHECEAEQEKARLGAGALGAALGHEAGSAFLGFDQVGIGALGAGAQDPRKRAKRAADHSAPPIGAGTSSGSGGKATMTASP